MCYYIQTLGGHVTTVLMCVIASFRFRFENIKKANYAQKNE